MKTVGPGHPGPAPAARPSPQPTGRPKPNHRPRCFPKIGLTADPAELPVLSEQVLGAGAAEMAPMRRGLSQAAIAETVRTIVPPTLPVEIGRRSACGI